MTLLPRQCISLQTKEQTKGALIPPNSDAAQVKPPILQPQGDAKVDQDEEMKASPTPPPELPARKGAAGKGRAAGGRGRGRGGRGRGRGRKVGSHMQRLLVHVEGKVVVYIPFHCQR